MNSVLFEDSTHGIIASDLSAVTGVLELVFTNVLPDLFNGLWSRKLDLYY